MSFYFSLVLSVCIISSNLYSNCFSTDSLNVAQLVYTDSNYNRVAGGEFYFQGYQVEENNLAQVYLFDKECRKKAVFFQLLEPETSFHGRFVEYHPNGRISYEGEFNRGRQEGEAKGYFESGKIRFERTTLSNPDSAFFTMYSKNGKKEEEGYLYKGNRIGWWKKYKGLVLWGKKYTDTYYENPMAVREGIQDVAHVMKQKFEMDTCLTSEYFVYFCREKQMKNARYADVILTQAMPQLIKKYQFKPDYKIAVSLFKNKKDLWIMSGRMRNEKTFIGRCLYSQKILLLTKSNHEISKALYKKTLVHELTHAIVAGIHRDSLHIPRWFNEGLAEVDSKSQKISLKRYKWLLKDDRPFKNFSSFNDGFYNKNSYHAYIYAYYTVLYIHEQYGLSKVNQFIRNPQNFESVFGLTDEMVWNDAKSHYLNKKLSLWEWIRSD